jgi:hypothetical protein
MASSNFHFFILNFNSDRKSKVIEWSLGSIVAEVVKVVKR